MNRLLDPGSEFHVHRQWFVDSAIDELLATDFAVAEKDRLYRCLERGLSHKQDLFLWLNRSGQTCSTPILKLLRTAILGGSGAITGSSGSPRREHGQEEWPPSIPLQIVQPRS